MDFRALVSKDSFKAVLIKHLKSRVKTKFSNTISSALQESFQEESEIVVNQTITSVSKDISNSSDFTELKDSFLKDVKDLLKDKESYVSKTERTPESSQCSSASSINASSIEFLSPNQFQSIIVAISSGTNAEKLIALSTLYRLPTLEHLTHQFSWTDVETGLYGSLSSDVIFLREECLKFYTKMLSCSEPKVVLDSYLSILKYFHDVLLPSLAVASEESNSVERFKLSVEILSILNKFLQNISAHWLRYPPTVIENIAMHSLDLFKQNDEMTYFPVWACVSNQDPDAKWLKNIVHGHVGRTSLIASLETNQFILQYVVNFCHQFISDEIFTKNICCQITHRVNGITHMICFLSHLIRYSDGRKLLSSISFESVPSNWLNVLDLLMSCSRKLTSETCCDCSRYVCEAISKAWICLWASDSGVSSSCELINLLLPPNFKFCCEELGSVYLTILCLSQSFEYIDRIHFDLMFCVDDFTLKLFSFAVSLYEDSGLVESSAKHLLFYNSLLVLTREFVSHPSTVFLNHDFVSVFTRWIQKVKIYSDTKFLVDATEDSKRKLYTIVSDIEKNTSEVFVRLLSNPITVDICHTVSLFENCLNVLLEKMLREIKLNNCLCPIDISHLSKALNRSITTHCTLNKTTVFRLSSVIWHFRDTNYDEDAMHSLRSVLMSLLPFIYCDLNSICTQQDGNVGPEAHLYRQLLLIPTILEDFIDYQVFEDYQFLALEVLSTVACSIHSLCKLEAGFGISKLLFEKQVQHCEFDGKPIISPVFILRNHILGKLGVIGGPNERYLPCENINPDNEEYSWTIIKDTSSLDSLFKYQTDIEECSIEINDLKTSLIEYLRTGKMSFDMVFKFMNKFLAVDSTEDYNSLMDTSLALSEEKLYGVELIIQYGIRLKLLLNTSGKDLERLLIFAKLILASPDDSELDLFVCVVYLMCKGDTDIAFRFLQNLKKSSNSILLWKDRLLKISKHSQSDYVYSKMLSFCDILVKRTLPEVFSALHFQGILPSTIYALWTGQCFLNYLDFTEICNYVLLSVTNSCTFTVYFFVSLLKHLLPDILKHVHNGDLLTHIIKSPIQHYETRNYIDFMYELAESSRNFSEIIEHLLNKIE